MTVRDRLLEVSLGYQALKTGVGADRATATIARDYVRPQPHDRVLDVGCGVGDLLGHLGDVDYVGIDLNEAYIATATRRSQGRGRFINASVDDLVGLGLRDFDVVNILGVLHHLSDEQVDALMRELPAIMRDGARLVVSENVWDPEQALVARLLIASDRGRHVRDAPGYLRFIEPHFTVTAVAVRHDLLRLPYSHIIIEAVR